MARTTYDHFLAGIGSFDPDSVNVANLIAAGDEARSLSLDLSDALAPADVNLMSNGAAGFGGYITTTTTIYFSSIKYLSLVLTPFDDDVKLDAAPLAARATLSLDGGDGHDSLTVDFSGLRHVVFEADSTGHVHSNYGHFSGFEEYSIQLGKGFNRVTTGSYGDDVTTHGGVNTIFTGDGMDEISSTGIDHVDGGGGYDFWSGHYAAALRGLSFSMQGTSAVLSNGTTLAGIESFDLVTGSGNDWFEITNPLSFAGANIDGRTGYDTLRVDFSGMDSMNSSNIRSNGERGFSGDLFGANAELSFSNIEHLSFTASFGDDDIRVDARASRAGSKLLIDGGDGVDLVHAVGLRAGYSILPNEQGGWIVNDIDRSDGDWGTFTINNVELLAFDDVTVDLTALSASVTAAFTGVAQESGIYQPPSVPDDLLATALPLT